MPYLSDIETEKEIKRLEKKITQEYTKAQKEITKTADAYFRSFQKKYDIMKKKYDNGVITRQEFQTWYKNAVGRGQRWEKLKDDIADRITRANEIATAYINDTTPTIVSINMNYENYEIEKGSGISFSIYDEQTIKRLIKDNPELLPKPRINYAQDVAWNKDKLNSALTSGIIQGKSVDKIAKEFQKVTNMNRVSAIRNARTAVTGAQNGGRQQSYINAEQMGIELEKEWVSTPDGLTRKSHQDIDGETIGIHDTFSNGCMYPGDPGGHPAEVYNCRCTLRSVVKGMTHHQGETRRYRDDETGKTYTAQYMTYNEWKKWKENNQ